MNTRLNQSRRGLITLVVATLLALSAAYAPVLLDGVAGTSMATQAYACQPNGGGC